MFSEFFLFEMRYQAKQMLFYICLAMFFLVTFGAVGSDTVSIGGAIGNVNRNAPYVIMQFLLVLSVFGVFTTTAFVAGSTYRDVEYATQPLFFSSPITKRGYLLGRFAGATVISFAIFLGVALAIILGSYMPWIEPDRIGPFRMAPYLVSLFFLVLPNIILAGAIFFSLAALTRSMMYTYAGVVAFFVGYIVGGVLRGDVQNQ